MDWPLSTSPPEEQARFIHQMNVCVCFASVCLVASWWRLIRFMWAAALWWSHLLKFLLAAESVNSPSQQEEGLNLWGVSDSMWLLCEYNLQCLNVNIKWTAGRYQKSLTYRGVTWNQCSLERSRTGIHFVGSRQEKTTAEIMFLSHIHVFITGSYCFIFQTCTATFLPQNTSCPW